MTAAPRSSKPSKPKDPVAKPAKSKAKPTRRAASAEVAAGAEKSAAPETLTLRWNLHELPSSQHKAGLAGLALWVRYLPQLGEVQGMCKLTQLSDTSLELQVDRAGAQHLFDKVYAADVEEVERDKKFQKKLAEGGKVDVEPRREVIRTIADKKGKAQEKTFFVYEQTIPRGALIADWDEGAAKLWLKLWRDMVWSILRGVPATREPYDARAEKREATDGAEAWDELQRAAEQGVELPSTYYLGAQAKSAENVGFRDRAKNRFLLHFWPFTAAIYVPAVIDREGKREFKGFVLAIPDIVRLEDFIERWSDFARRRGDRADGYRPREAVVDVAAEAALELASRMYWLIEQGKVPTAPWIGSVDTYHLEKDGNNVRIRSVSRIDLHRSYVDDYRHAREHYWSPLFRRQVILNILGHARWWHGFGALCATSPKELTIEDRKTFAHDCREAFKKERTMSENEPDALKDRNKLIFEIVRTYVFGKLKSKYGLEWNPSWGSDSERAENGEGKKEAYNDKKEKIAREAFLAVRSRTGSDFVTYFTGTLCSVHQRIGPKGYHIVAQALQDDDSLEEVRSLTLLALAAV
jgi:CRISPR-associated protein Cmx8